MTSAILATTNGVLTGAAKMYGVLQSTLRFILPSTVGHISPGHPTYFSESKERQLADHCIRMASLRYGYARWQVIEIAANMTTMTGRSMTPTKHWFPDLEMINPKKRENCRADSVSSDVVSTYYENLESVLKSSDILNKPADIWNVDETGLIPIIIPQKFFGKKDRIQWL